MIIKVSRTVRHVSRTDRVAFDWLFDKTIWIVKLKSKTSIQKKQLADMLTTRNFARDEKSHVLHLFNIMSFSMFSCSNFSPINDPQTLSNRMMQREKTGEDERVVAKQSQS